MRRSIRIDPVDPPCKSRGELGQGRSLRQVWHGFRGDRRGKCEDLVVFRRPATSDGAVRRVGTGREMHPNAAAATAKAA